MKTILIVRKYDDTTCDCQKVEKHHLEHETAPKDEDHSIDNVFEEMADGQQVYNALAPGRGHVEEAFKQFSRAVSFSPRGGISTAAYSIVRHFIFDVILKDVLGKMIN